MKRGTVGSGRQNRRPKNRKYGSLVAEVARISGRSRSTVYAVLSGRIRSEPVSTTISVVQAKFDGEWNHDGRRR